MADNQPAKPLAIEAVVHQIADLEDVLNSKLPAKVEQTAQNIAKLQMVANVLFAPTALFAMPPMHRAQIELIKIDPDPKLGEVYKITGSAALGLSKVSIFRILKAAGLSWSRPRKLSRDSDVDYYCYAAKVWGPQPDGRLFIGEDTADWSFCKRLEANKQLAEKKLTYCDNDQERAVYLPIERWAMKRTLEERAYAGERTATRSLLRAARAVLSLKTAYLPQELQKPFLVARTIPALDMRDPQVRREYQTALIGSMTSVYGQPTIPQHADEPETIDAEYRTDTSYDDQAEEDAVAAQESAVEEQPTVPTESVDAATGEVAKLPPAAEMTEEQRNNADLDAKLVGVAKKLGRDGFQSLLHSHDIKSLKAASLDMKTLIYEEAISGQRSLF